MSGVEEIWPYNSYFSLWSFIPGQLAVGLGSWVMLHWEWGGGIQLEGSREQSYVPAPGHCAQEFENAAILSLVTTFLPLPSAPACLTKAHTLLSSPSDRARKLS